MPREADHEDVTVLGPTFAQMLHPYKVDPGIREHARRAAREDPLHPVNLYNITWRGGDGGIRYEVIPEALTGVEAPIVVLYSKDFPTGSHKVGAAYAALMEEVVTGRVDPARHTLVWPSTGNYGIGGAWVGGRMGFQSLVVLPEGMSAERFERIESYGAEIVKTPGSESNVKEIYDHTRELRRADPNVRILNQFESLGNYRFHYYVTGNTIVEMAQALAREGLGRGRIAAFVSAMGSAGTIAAGDRLKQVWPEARLVGLEPIQCPTLYNNGYGAHEIQGIGDKHVTWIHHVTNMDALMCLDDLSCLKGLQVLTEEAGWGVLERAGVGRERIEPLASIFGISGVCNLLGAIKTAKFYGLGREDVIVTVCTDAIDRYRSVMHKLSREHGPMDPTEARVRLVGIFHGTGLDWIKEGTRDARRQWHNLKYYTWVEQQGKTVEALDAQLDPEWWEAEQARVAEIDRRLVEARSQDGQAAQGEATLAARGKR